MTDYESIFDATFAELERGHDLKTRNDYANWPLWDGAREYHYKATGESVYSFFQGFRAPDAERAGEKLGQQAVKGWGGATCTVTVNGEKEVEVLVEDSSHSMRYVLRAFHPESERAPKNRPADFWEW